MVGVFERIEDGKLSVAKVTFGAEPKDYEVQEYIQKYYFACLNRAVEYVQLSEELERRFMAAVKRMKQAFNLFEAIFCIELCSERNVDIFCIRIFYAK